MVAETHLGVGAVPIVQRHVVGFIDGARTRCGARVHEIARHLGLAVDGHTLPDQLLQRDAMAPPAKADLDTVMHQPFGVQA